MIQNRNDQQGNLIITRRHGTFGGMQCPTVFLSRFWTEDLGEDGIVVDGGMDCDEGVIGDADEDFPDANFTRCGQSPDYFNVGFL